MLSAVIIVGGRGTRLSPVTCNVPKPLVNILDKPFLYHLISQAYESGVRKIILLAGYLGKQFENFIGTYANYFPELEIILKISNPNLDTGDRLLNAFNILEERFILMYGDNYVPFNFKDYINKYENDIQKSFILLYRNDDKYSYSNILLGNNNLVLNYGKSENKEVKYVDIGYFIFNRIDLINFKKGSSLNIGKDIISKLIKEKKLYGEVIRQRYYTVGTMDRLQQTRTFFSKRNFIFIDRDGVLNKKQPRGHYVTNFDLFKWKPGSLEGLKILKENNFQVIVITNQAGIGRGIFTENQLNTIHQKMCHDAKKNKGEIEYIYFCPHHWDDNCDCRKPKAGMFFKAQKDLYIDLPKTYFIGDDKRDGEAAKTAGCKFRLIRDFERLDEVIQNIFNFKK